MPHTLSDEEHFCLEGCRGYKQYHHMRKNFEQKFCTFCQLDRELNRVLWEDAHAFCWPIPEKFQRQTLAIQFLAVPKRHVRARWELTDSEALSLHHAEQMIAKNAEPKGGMEFARFGLMHLNAGTVPHYHVNIWVPNGTGEVRIPVIKDPTDRDENRARAAEFARRYEAGEIPE